MTFEVDPEVGAVLAAMAADSGPMPSPPPVGDVDGRRVALNAMLEYANNVAQPIAGEVEITEREVVAADNTVLRARWYQLPSSDSSAAVLYLHGGGMILGNVPIFDGPVSRYVASTGVSMLSLEYRLAPEHPHPTPVEDAYTGLVWLADHRAPAPDLSDARRPQHHARCTHRPVRRVELRRQRHRLDGSAR